MRIVSTATLIFIFWFVLSGHTSNLLIILGIASTGLTVYLSRRMNIIDAESYPFHLSFSLFRYNLYLFKEILIANIDVIKRILSPSVAISPQVTELPASQHSDLSKVIYANSITLTPGTVTLELSGGKLKVHALSHEGIEDLEQGNMAKQVPEDKDHIS
ncbi:MAG: Na+/H+ antiporter subunit E [Gammaproteobacteria bacterium]|nr:Na+/H+ antiporter subunit E [Gammaproteobacteria bacterium]